MASLLVEDAVTLFDDVWPEFGSPLARIYAPISEWELAAGVTYDKTQDRFEDALGDEVEVDHATQPYTEAAYIPVVDRENPVLAFAGTMDLPGVEILIRYSSTVDTALNDYWAIQVAGKLHRTVDHTEWEYIPAAVSAPALIRVRLQEQVEVYA